MRQAALEAWLANALSLRCTRTDVVSGGCVNKSFKCTTPSVVLFVKATLADAISMLEAEAAGLAQLQSANAIRVPRVLACGTHSGHAFLALEWMEFIHNTQSSAEMLGRQLAALHRVGAPRFGWSQDNAIGSTAQRNMWSASWSEFWRTSRLGPLLEMAQARGAGANLVRRGQQLLEVVPQLLNHSPAPSLLHGDLWGGNWATANDGRPVIFDPAVYFGDHETDIAMTRLFGGFDRSFYAAYEAECPLDAGARVRATLYNLYHVLNHFILFGGGYGMQAEHMIEQLLAEQRG